MRTARRGPPTNPPARGVARGVARRVARRGATLVELMVALLLLTVGVIATAGTSRVVAHELDAALHLDVGTRTAASRLDSLRALDCDRVAAVADSGIDSIPPDARVAWAVAREDDGDLLLNATALAPDGRVTLDLRARRRCTP